MNKKILDLQLTQGKRFCKQEKQKLTNGTGSRTIE